jgi:hypothetical protein
MKPALFRCRRSGELVKHFGADQPNRGDQHRYGAICRATCSWSHMINRATGKALGEKD